MKSKFLRILALILVMSSLLSMFAIFANAEETGENEGETEEDSLFNLVYYRTYDEGWDIKNGMALTDQGSTGSTTFEIEYEETADFKINYFWRLELNSRDNDFVQLNTGARAEVGAVFEVDIKSDDVCSFDNVITFGTKGNSSNERSDYKFLTIVNNKVYLMRDNFPDAEPVFELTNEWTRLQIVFDYTYEHFPAPDHEETAEELVARQEQNNKWFQAYIYYGDPEKPSEMTLFTGGPLTLEARSGRGIQIFRFQSTGSDSEEYFGTGLCLDNMKYYDGVNHIVPITEDMGHGSGVNESYVKTIDIIGGNTSAGSADDIRAALSMKVGVDYCFINKMRRPIATTADGTAYGAPVKMNGEIMISLDKVLEFLGYKPYIHPDGAYIDIATGDTATYLVVGKKEATVSGERVALNAAPGYITDEDGNTFVAIALADVEKLFPGFYGDYDEMGYMTVSANPDMLDRERNLSAMVSVMKEFVFEYFTQEQIYADVEAHTNGFQHPYILANGDDIELMYNEYQALNAKAEAGTLVENSDEYWTWVHYQRIVDTGENYYKYYAKPDANGTYATFAGVAPDEYNADGTNKRGTHSLDQNYLDASGYDIGGRSDITNRTNRLEGMAFAYVLTRDIKYLQLCYEVSIILGNWTHWGPGHFLNCADSSNDFAVYYDWTYNGYVELKEQGIKREDGSDYEVSVLAEILARQGVHEGYYSTMNKTSDHLSPVVGTGGGHYTERDNNWAAVCTGGMAVASLAILGDVDEQYVYEATYILSSNFKTLIARGLDCYAPDGSYNEGPGYWNYGTNTFFRMCAALDSAAGTNYGLMDCWGIDTTCYYACYTEDNDAKYFPFHDGSVGSQDTSYFFYVADYFNDATLYDVRLKQINGNVKWATLVDMIYYPRDIEINAEEVSLDYYSDTIDLFSTRSSWERGALFASIIGGNNNVTHGQIDAGDFVYHNGGTIWIYDLGTENYNCAGFWPAATRYRYYVMKPEGNNTVAITTDPAGVPYGQKLDAIANATSWGSNEHGSYVVYDMGDTLGQQVSSWQRGMLLTNDRKTTVIQDQISFKSMQTVYWFAHYSLAYVDKVEVSKDGRTAYMRESLGQDEHGRELYQTLRLTLVSSNSTLKFQMMDTYTFIHKVGEDATYSPENVLELGPVAEKSRKNFRKLAITSGEALGFEVAVVIELVDDTTVGKSTEIDVGYTFDNMERWTPYADTRGIKIEDTNTVIRRGIPNVNTHLVQSMSKIDAMVAKNDHFGAKIKEYYRCVTDAHYVVRFLGTDMPAGYESQTSALKQHRDAFNAYRNSVLNLQKDQTQFIYKLMGLV